jgi:DNA (cytosine-5)-methyltransferase 1
MNEGDYGQQPTHLDLFSGIGGFALAARWAGFRTIGFCEIDKYCQKVLAKNFLADTERAGSHGANSDAPKQGSNWSDYWIPERGCFTDIHGLDGTRFRGAALVTGGFPCQPFSCAGERRGKEDDRHLWPEMLRVIDEARPAWVLGENVAGIIKMELDSVLSDLESIGYATRDVCYSSLRCRCPAQTNAGMDCGLRRKRRSVAA